MASISYNVKNFSDSDIGFTLSRDSFSQPAEPRFNSYNLTSANGAVLQNTNWSPQIITVNGVLIGSSFSDKMSKYRKMLGYLYTTGSKSLIFSKEPTIEYISKLSSAPSVTTLSETAMEIQLEFVSQYGRDTTDTTVTGTTGAFVCDCTNSNFYVYPKIDMTGLTPGVALITISAVSPDTQMIIQNWPYDTLNITTEPGNKMIAYGVTANMQYLTDASEFPILLPFTAAQQIIISVSSGTASTTITYRNVYK